MKVSLLKDFLLPGCRVSDVFRHSQNACFSSISLESLPKMRHNVLSVPDQVRGMKVMDKSTFRKTVDIHCYSFDTSKAQQVQKLLKPYLLKIPKFAPIVSGTEVSCRVAHLDPNKISSGFSDFEPVTRQKLADVGTPEETTVRKVELTYDNYTHDEILRAIIPEDLDAVTSFSIIGHIVHLNLRPELNEYKTVIGQVLLDKIPHARTVVTKTDNIDSKFRNFKMEIIAGEEDFIATTKENRAIFKLDFSKVYWNPRLCTEHDRFVSRLSKGDVLFDVFCGIGPFVIPAAKKGVQCFANDLNPDSIHWLRENLKTNHIDQDLVSISISDGVNFINDVFKKSLPLLPTGDYRIAIAMNLPSLAYQFLAAFKGLFSEDDAEALASSPVPVVYCYMFLKGVPEAERCTAARKIVENELGNLGNEEFLRVDFVRNVAPNKDMVVVGIRLTENILVNRKRARLLPSPLEAKNS